MSKKIKPLLLPLAAAAFILSFSLIFAAIILIIILSSLGLLSFAVSAGTILGFLSNIATDLAPPAMLLAGVFCISASLALIMVLFITAPKAVTKFLFIWEWFRL